MSFTFEYLGLDGKILVTEFALRATASLRTAVFASSDGITKDRCLTPWSWREVNHPYWRTQTHSSLVPLDIWTRVELRMECVYWPFWTRLVLSLASLSCHWRFCLCYCCLWFQRTVVTRIIDTGICTFATMFSCVTRCTRIPPFLAVVVQYLLNASI